MDEPLNLDSRKMNWPNFFAVGPPRSGTTSLYVQLKRHPQVFLPEVKEVNYFSTRTDITFSHYRRLYQNAHGFPAIGDISPYYLWDKNAPRKIHAVSPAAKIIFTLRDPIERAFSQYLQYRRAGSEPQPSFESALRRLDNKGDKLREYSCEYVELGMYSEHVQRYLDVFGPSKVLILLTEDLSRDPRELFLRIATHLGIDPDPFTGDSLGEAYNAFRLPRFRRLYHIIGTSRTKQIVMEFLPGRLKHWLKESPLLYARAQKPRLDDGARKLLQEIYDPDIIRLENLVGRKFPELRQSWA
jgi:Sulfotransferase domain